MDGPLINYYPNQYVTETLSSLEKEAKSRVGMDAKLATVFDDNAYWCRRLKKEFKVNTVVCAQGLYFILLSNTKETAAESVVVVGLSMHLEVIEKAGYVSLHNYQKLLYTSIVTNNIGAFRQLIHWYSKYSKRTNFETIIKEVIYHNRKDFFTVMLNSSIPRDSYDQIIEKMTTKHPYFHALL